MKKHLLLFLLFTGFLQAQTYPVNPTKFGKISLNTNITDTTAVKVNVQSSDNTINTIPKSDLIEVLEYASAINLPVTGKPGKIYVTKDDNKLYRWNGTVYVLVSYIDISGKENTANKQNSLVVDGTGTKYPTVDAVNAGLGAKQNVLTNPVTGTGTTDYIPKFMGSGTLGNSIMNQEGSGGMMIDGQTKAGYLHMKAAGVSKWVFGGNSGEGTDNFNLYNFNTLSINFSVKEATGNASFSNDLSVGGALSATSYTGGASLTGTPTAPTAAVGTTGNQIATLDYVQGAIQASVNGLQEVLDTYASWTKTEDNVVKTIDFSADGLYGSNSDILFRADKDTESSRFVMTSGSIVLKNIDSSTGITDQISPNGFYKYVSGGSSTETSIDNPVANTTLKFPAKTVAGNYTINTTPDTTYTVSTLPSGVLNDMAIVTDATAPTYLGALTGGGAVVCPVWHNGTIWVAH